MFCASMLSNVFGIFLIAPLVLGFIWCLKCTFVDADGVSGAETLFFSLVLNVIWAALLVGLKKLFT